MMLFVTDGCMGMAMIGGRGDTVRERLRGNSGRSQSARLLTDFGGLLYGMVLCEIGGGGIDICEG